MNKLLTILLLVNITSIAQNSNFVNVFIGTQGTGHTFPGPSMPFGMVQPGPDNKDYGWGYTSGYQYNDTMLLGFSQTRFSGTGINEMGDVLLLPINPQKENRKNTYYKNTEIGKVGYYALTKKDDVKVALTCTERVAFHKYTYPNKEAQVLVDLQHGLRFIFTQNNTNSLVVNSKVKIENNTTITGFCETKNWVNRKYFFKIVFDVPFTSSNIINNNSGNKAPQYLLNFTLNNNKTLQVKVALSSVGVNGAALNMEKEINGFLIKQKPF